MNNFACDLKIMKGSYEKIKFFHWTHFSFLVLALCLQMYFNFQSLWNLLTIAVLIVLYRHLLTTIRNAFYTYWFMAGVLLIYLSIGLIKSCFIYDGGSLVLVHCLAIIFLLLQMHLLNNPIFFPRIHWWEYDFRYRHELRVDVQVDDKHYEGRMGDFRRGAACLVCLDQLPLGREVTLKILDSDYVPEIKVDVVSHRFYSIGRGIMHGIQFKFESATVKNDFYSFIHRWIRAGAFKTRLKFERLKRV